MRRLFANKGMTSKRGKSMPTTLTTMKKGSTPAGLRTGVKVRGGR